LTGALTAGQGVDALIRVRLGGTAAVDGFCSLAKVFWDASGDGTIDDSTSGANVSTWIWHTVVPPVTEGIRPAVIARAIDKNNVWSAPETLLVKFGMQRPIVMKDIPAGTFSMGEAGVADSVHQVTLRAFRIQETEVTQEQYLAVMGKNPSYFPGDFSRPVEQANWNDAVQFCNELSALTGLTPVYDTATLTPDNTKTGYRLPTEAQWEYACRAGSTTPYWWAADTNGLGASAWWYGNSSGTTHPVASKSANGWGLFDMAGNVLEWCNDWYAGYAPGAATDPTGASSGTYRVIRGGCLADMSARLRSASRLKGIPGYRPVGPGYAGFRVALPPQ
jgi:formylglycine-generating enzyme required for sulfatase activity